MKNDDTVKNTAKLCDGCGLVVSETKVPAHTTSKYGIPITLVESAIQITCGCDDDIDISVPYEKKLIQAAAFYRATVPDRINGTELGFFRTTLGYSSKDFSSELGVAPETLSRWESDQQKMSASHEKLARMLVVFGLKGEVPTIYGDPEEICKLKLKGWLMPDRFPDMTFKLSIFHEEEYYSNYRNAA